MLATISTARMLLAASHPHSVGGGGGVVATTLSACLSSLLHQHQHHQPPQQQQQHAALLSSTSAAAAVSQPHPPAAGGHSQQQTDTAEASSTSSSGAGRDDDTIDFGFRTVARQEKESLVGHVFSSVASSYDIMNDLMSGGLHRLWKDRLVDSLGPFAGMQHLDVAGGTGDVAFRVLRAIQAAEQQQQPATTATAAHTQPQPQQPQQQSQMPQPPPVSQQQQQLGHVTVFDINAEMLKVGQQRAQEQGLSSGLSWAQGNAQELPFPDACMDAYTVAFGIRNMTDRAAALSEAHRVLKRGGRLLCLEFSHVSLPVLKQAYDLYSFSVIPKIGGLVAGDEASYQYLVESIRQFPDQESWAEQIRAAGFKAVTYENLTGGVVAIHSGFKL